MLPGATWAERLQRLGRTKPGPPHRIHGNSWYVGTCGIAAILVTGEAGHILIDGGTARGADPANIGAPASASRT